MVDDAIVVAEKLLPSYQKRVKLHSTLLSKGVETSCFPVIAMTLDFGRCLFANRLNGWLNRRSRQLLSHLQLL
ncbi:hypothetical protein OH492_28705 [Vibrio chagasii]|nr:hypothetical protein [Vibrio chagasii]